ncbi:MAG: hypothetical protein GXO58_03165 [Thermodesulfobacteria bacterium]|nr:hypothetical protein [Thermodesulfobacteriota bacterium]
MPRKINKNTTAGRRAAYHKFYALICMLLLAVFFPGTGYCGWPWQDATLVTIDDQDYTTKDFQVWWENWKEKGQKVIRTPDPYINWILQYREAERMRLYEDPVYRHKVLTFLKAQTLMLLKAEEIDSKINISERDIEEYYQKNYTPIYQVKVLSFVSGDDANALLDTVKGKQITVALLEELASDSTNKMRLESKLLRPAGLDPEVLKALQGLAPGELSAPIIRKKATLLLFLEQAKPGNKHDLAMVQRNIHETLWKKEENRLTTQLLKKLRKRYEVTVDRERLQSIDINKDLDSFSDEPLIRTKNGNISEKQFMAQLIKQRRFRRHNGFAIGDAQTLKEQVANGIIDQTLTSWEALDRGYEKKPPLKQRYEFYCQHRLIKALDRRLLKGMQPITHKDIEQYYKENISQFTTPEIIRMIVIEGTKKDMDSLWTEVAMGGNFQDLIEKRSGHTPPIREIPANHLDPEVKAVVDSLGKGEVSPVFTVKGHISMLQLLERKPPKVIPLDRVATQIRKKLQEQREKQVKDKFLARLRDNSTIEVNNGTWQKLRQELVETDTEHAQ